jgi:uncharacterized protein (TIGR02147 family)
MIFTQINYRQFLKGTLANKKAENPNYSLRAFSQKIGLSVSYLSEVLSNKKSISLETAFRIALKLNLTEQESQYFFTLVQLENETDPEDKQELVERLNRLNPNRGITDLSLDIFKIVSDWYHFAILELTYLKNFKLTAESVANKLNIDKLIAEEAIDRLLRLELLEKLKNGNFKKTNAQILAQSHVPNRALKLHHQQLLEKAKLALVEQLPSNRISNSHILPIDKADIKIIDQIIDECISKIINISTKSKNKNEVYCLSTHFFNLTNPKEDI